jgi:hypothetical protein
MLSADCSKEKTGLFSPGNVRRFFCPNEAKPALLGNPNGSSACAEEINCMTSDWTPEQSWVSPYEVLGLPVENMRPGRCGGNGKTGLPVNCSDDSAAPVVQTRANSQLAGAVWVRFRQPKGGAHDIVSPAEYRQNSRIIVEPSSKAIHLYLSLIVPDGRHGRSEPGSSVAATRPLVAARRSPWTS